MAWSTGNNGITPTHMAVLETTLYTLLASGTIMTTDLTTGQTITQYWCMGYNSNPFSDKTRIVANPSTNTLYVLDSMAEKIYSVNSYGIATIFFNPNPQLGDNYFDGPSGIFIFDGYLYVQYYYLTTSPSICKINLADPTSYTLQWAYSHNLGGTIGMCVNNGIMYALCMNSQAYNMTHYTSIAIVSVNMSTGAITPIAPLYQSGGFPNDIAVYDNILYISRHDFNAGIDKISLTGTILNVNWKPLPYCGGMIIYGTDMYASDYGGDIYKFSMLPPLPCFKEGTKILTDKGYVPVEQLRKGDYVKTLLNEYKPVYMIGSIDISHPASAEKLTNQLYVAHWSDVPDLVEDLVITGSHCTLVDAFEDGQREKVIEVNGKIYVTDKKYRVPACVDTRFSVYEPAGEYTIYHFALENDNYLMNYGIYANGLLVETCSKRCIEGYPNLKILV